MGGTHSHSCNKVAKKIWLWCISKQIWLSCSHLPGKQNILADSLSRLTESNSTEWSLRQDVFSRISAVFGKPHIDLFASSLNFKVIKFASWKADPNAFVIDAFTCNWSDHFFYAFPPFSLISRCLQEIEQDKARGILILPLWPTQAWFAKFLVLLAAKAKTCRLPFVRKYLRNKRVSEQAISIISASWRECTQKQYDTYHRKWSIFCNESKINPFQPSLIEVLDFLTDLFLRGLGYSGLNTARAALSTFLILNGVKTIGQHPLICRFLKGVFELRPPSARYTTSWDVSVVLNFLRELHPLDSLSLKLVTLKLVMLVALVSAQRLQSLQLLDLSTMTKSATSYTFTINQLIKQSRPGYSTTITVFLPDFEDSRISVYKVLEHYLILTFPLRQHCSRLFISYVKPYKPVSRDTLGRWIKTALASAGIDVGVFKAHSTTSAAVSAAKQNSLPVEHILKTAGWKSESTFAKFYNKPISHTDSSFSSAVLTPQDQT
ncbi:hypothetical protein HOLleu_16457 [Holothuria leucospilota]|uniref:Tyr recombinase domain-containing protein n=2 Tax=Holothuria leucospilota TaxID=206669 RepID=A0A9Q1C5A2_HOLLE|nr:hypothetical protein HOLleu_16457 [Holothuria leucospilota]